MHTDGVTEAIDEMIEVFAERINGNIAILESVLPYLPEDKIERLRRYIHREDYLRSLTGEFLIRNIISHQLNIDYPNIALTKNEYGKPFIEDYPDFHFNISHSGNWVVCAISNMPVGIDIELMKPIDYSLAEHFFYPREYERLVNAENKSDCFYDIWTLKESFIKAVGTGLSLPLTSFGVKTDGDLISLEYEGYSGYTFQRYFLDPDYKLAVCGQENEFSHNVIIISEY